MNAAQPCTSHFFALFVDCEQKPQRYGDQNLQVKLKSTLSSLRVDSSVTNYFNRLVPFWVMVFLKACMYPRFADTLLD